MIFVPKENIRKWRLDKYSEYIIWEYNKFIEIHFIHSFETDGCYIKEIHTTTDGLSTGYRSEILKCPELACNNYPELRYNAVIKKYFCVCPGSMVDVDNTDESEIKHLKEHKTTEFIEAQGYFDNPLKAVLSWQKSIAEYHFNETNNLIERFF